MLFLGEHEEKNEALRGNGCGKGGGPAYYEGQVVKRWICFALHAYTYLFTVF
jgi:hypothetical protein